MHSSNAPFVLQVRILSLDPEDCLKSLATQAVNAAPDSLLLLESPSVGVDGTEEGAGAGSLFLHIGTPHPHPHPPPPLWHRQGRQSGLSLYPPPLPHTETHCTTQSPSNVFSRCR